MVASLEKSLAKQVERGKLEQSDADEVRGRVSATDHLGALVDCDLVIESVVEDLEIKRALFAELDSIVKDGAILATNTSTLPVVEMAVATHRPDRVLGVHFFNPAPAMSLVEIIAPADRLGRDRRRGDGLRRGVRQERRARSRTGPASSSTRCCSPT